MQILMNRLGVAAASLVILRGRGNNIETKGGKIRFAKSKKIAPSILLRGDVFH